MVDLKTGQFLQADPERFVSKSCSARFNPDAKCPRWERFLEDIFNGDMGMIAYVQRMVGYILTGETRERKFFFLNRRGSNGKGKFTGTLKKLLADYAKTLPKEYLMRQRFGRAKGGTDDILAGLRSVRYVHASEGDSDNVLDEARMKEISGEVEQVAAHKFERSFEFMPICKLVFDTNYMPLIYSQDDAIWRRVIAIVLPNSYANPGDENYRPNISKPKDVMLGEKLASEMEGILAWAVRGAVEYYRDGLGVEPACAVQARAGYRVQTDATSSFLEACTETDTKGFVQAGDLYKAYCAYIERNAEGRAVSSTAFGLILGEKGFEKEDRGGKRYRLGLRLNKIGKDYASGIDPSDLSIIRTSRPDPLHA